MPETPHRGVGCLVIGMSGVIPEAERRRERPWGARSGNALFTSRKPYGERLSVAWCAMQLEPDSPVGRLSGKRVVITGAARGIGADMARTFAAEGADLALVDVLADELRAVADDIGAQVVVGDLRAPDAAQSTINAAIDLLGGVDVLVNNAGVLRFSSILDMTVEDWDLTFEVNARSMLITTQAAVRRMIAVERGSRNSVGKIVNMASMGGKLGSPNQAHYCASKAAVIAFTRVSAMEFGPYGINVNCICPGYVLTEMGAATRTPEMVAAWSSKSPLARLAEPSDVSRTALFLASSDSDYCTGQAMNVSGGMVMH
jgi:NAD(P)-dependent dehydrogenase (short-subunit alcohol dehydrogenase family)